MSKRFLSFGLAVVCSLAASPMTSSWVASAMAAPADAGSPKATLQRLNGACERLLRMKTEPGSAEESRVKQEIKKNASALLDYGELCKRALGEHWDKMGEPKRIEFVATLRELIERNYIRQLRTNLDYDVTYGDESADGNEAKVATTLRLATKGKTTQVQIDYRLIKRDGGTLWIHESGAGIFDEAGQLLFLEGACIDISLQKDQEQKLADLIAQLSGTSNDIVGAVQRILKELRTLKLLALNARIEAVRAAEHGVGFAVVAEEMKALTESTRGEADRISELMDTLQRLMKIGA